MNTIDACLNVRGIDVEVNYKDIKNLHISVYPPFGNVRVAAPLRLDEDQIRLAVIQRLPWIKRHRRQLQDASRQSRREMVTGESHYLWGTRYRLKVAESSGRGHLQLDGSRLLMTVPQGTDADSRIRLMEQWQREELRVRLFQLIEKWEPKIGQSVPFWSIRKMKTKWGSCNPDTGHIWFNLELVKKNPLCVEYIVVHEMAHLIERLHNDHFITLMDTFLPDWSSRRDQLNGAPLKHENWNH